jgi:hypothetical protein
VRDKPFYAPTAKPLPSRVARPGEPLFSFVSGHDRFACELRYHGEWGVEAQFLKNEELLIGPAVRTRALAVRWAEEEQTALRRGAGGLANIGVTFGLLRAPRPIPSIFDFDKLSKPPGRRPSAHNTSAIEGVSNWDLAFKRLWNRPVMESKPFTVKQSEHSERPPVGRSV